MRRNLGVRAATCHAGRGRVQAQAPAIRLPAPVPEKTTSCRLQSVPAKHGAIGHLTPSEESREFRRRVRNVCGHLAARSYGNVGQNDGGSGGTLGASTPSGALSLYDALQKQLGLKLEATEASNAGARHRPHRRTAHRQLGKTEWVAGQVKAVLSEVGMHAFRAHETLRYRTTGAIES